MKALKRAPTFTQWLRFFRPGRVAAWALADQCWPKHARTVTTFIEHLAAHQEPRVPSEAELRICFAKFRIFLRSGEKLPSRGGMSTGGHVIIRYVSLSVPVSAMLDDLRKTELRSDGRPQTRSSAIEAAILHYYATRFNGVKV